MMDLCEKRKGKNQDRLMKCLRFNDTKTDVISVMN